MLNKELRSNWGEVRIIIGRSPVSIELGELNKNKNVHIKKLIRLDLDRETPFKIKKHILNLNGLFGRAN